MAAFKETAPVSDADVEANDRWLRGLARSLTKDGDAADDLVQETFVALLKSERIEGVPLRAWLAGVLRNVHRMWRRTGMRRDKREASSDEPPRPRNVDSTIHAARIAKVLIDEVDNLNEPYRTTLRLRYYDGLSQAEIAKRMGVPEPTVRRRSQIALRALRTKILNASTPAVK